MNTQTSPAVAICFIHVKKHFRDRDVEALGGIDLDVAQGGIYFLDRTLRIRKEHPA